MNKLSCIFNYQTLFEAFIIGFITLTIGKIAFNLTLNKKNIESKEKISEPFGLNITLFITGFFLHFIIEIIGLNKWYCNNKCSC